MMNNQIQLDEENCCICDTGDDIDRDSGFICSECKAKFVS